MSSKDLSLILELVKGTDRIYVKDWKGESGSLKLRDTEIETWFERDRAWVALCDKKTGNYLIEWWDESVEEAVEDGFLDPSDWHGSAFEYWMHLNKN